MQQRRVQKELQQNKQRQKQLAAQKGQVSDELKNIQSKISDKEKEAQAIKKQLEQTQAGLDKAQGEKKKIEDHLSGYRDALGSRMRSVYMRGDVSYLDLLFSAGSFSDFVDRVFYVQTICGRDEDLISKTQHDQDLLADKITQINTKLAEIARYREAQKVQLSELHSLKQEKDDDLETINNNLELAVRAEKELQQESAAIGQLIRSSSHSASGYRGAPWTASFKKPVPGPIVSGFGMRFHPVLHYSRMHTGVDIGAGYGTPIHAAGNGKVIRTGWMGGYGNCVIIDHGGSPNRSTLYGHMSEIDCVAGQVVTPSTIIGKVGATGLATGPHLHFEVRINGTPVNPLAN